MNGAVLINMPGFTLEESGEQRMSSKNGNMKLEPCILGLGCELYI